jgi:hypothetical protein
MGCIVSVIWFGDPHPFLLDDQRHVDPKAVEQDNPEPPRELKLNGVWWRKPKFGPTVRTGGTSLRPFYDAVFVEEVVAGEDDGGLGVETFKADAALHYPQSRGYPRMWLRA